MQKPLAHILLVDDDDITNFVNKILLSKLEVADNISVAYGGEEALDFIQSHWAVSEDGQLREGKKLILVDLNMPGMDGFAFIEHFEATTNSDNIIIAVLTSSNSEKDVEKAKQYHVLDYIEKPLTHDKIQHLLAKVQ